MNEDLDLFSRYGHLTGLTIDRYDADELDARQRGSVEHHLEGCFECRRHLGHVRAHVVSIAPPAVARPSTGSVTLWGLAASGGLGLAAAVVLGLISAPWPGPQRFEPASREAMPLASAYTTSTTQPAELDEAEQDETPSVELSVHGAWLEVDPRAEGHLAVVVAPGSDAAADTDGEEVDEVIEVLRAPSYVEADASSTWRHRLDGVHRVVALWCAEPFEVSVGDTVAPGAECRRYELEARFGAEQRDS